MSNSSLVTYKYPIKTDHYNIRDSKIDTITIHHAANGTGCNRGYASNTLQVIFASVGTNGSVNYAIDSNGTIGQMLDESLRSWCTNSRPNDMRAVTMEVANDMGAPSWHVSDKALKSIIKLCADICKRNGKKKMVWIADKNTALNYTPKSDEMRMTLHKWFAGTGCPEQYLISKMPYIAQEVNKMLNSVQNTAKKSSTTLLNYDQFQAKYLGKAVDYDGILGLQCVDIADQYLKDCFGITGIWVNGACDFYNYFNNYPALVNAFTRVPNTRDLIIAKGDIVVWGGGTWGHVAIGNGQGTLDWFVSLEENTRGQNERTQLITHYFNGYGAYDGCNPVLGVLRPKDQKRIQGDSNTYKTYYANDPSGVNYRATPNGTLKGTYKYGATVSVLVGSDTLNGGLTWVKAKNGYWSAKNLLSTSKPVTNTEPYQSGKTYTLETDMKVRAGATAGAPQLKTSALTASDKKNAYNQTYAVLKKGTKITLRGVVKIGTNEYWGRIASGYVCLKTSSKVYVK